MYFFNDANRMLTELYGFAMEDLKQVRIFRLRPGEEQLESVKLVEHTRDNLIYNGESTHQKKMAGG